MSAMFRINQIQGNIRPHGYDQNGNRKTLRGTGTHQQPKAKVDYTYAANSNRLATITRGGIVTSPAHLTEGELRLDFVSGYDSHGQRRWSGMRNGDTTQPEYYFAYNHKRERTVRSIRGNGGSWRHNSIQYVYDEASHLIGEYKSDGTPIVECVWKGDVPIAAIYGSTSATKIYYIITDAQNTPRRLIDSSNNAVVWAWDSTAFGVAQPSIQTVVFNLRFHGQYYDEITKQHYNLNRYYNPEIGRYMEADPIGLEGGLNPYAYAGSNPVMNVDPSGLMVPMNDIDLSRTIGLTNSLNDNAFNSFLNGTTLTQLNDRQLGDVTGQAGPAIPLVIAGYTYLRSQVVHNAPRVGAAVESLSPAAAGSVGVGAVGAGVRAINTIDPATVRYSQSSISPYFRNGSSAQEFAFGLKAGTIDPSSVPAIRLVQRDGVMYRCLSS